VGFPGGQANFTTGISPPIVTVWAHLYDCLLLLIPLQDKKGRP